ncbi:MAG: metal ABC transporter permease [Roseinatronobacter sp.]
MTTLFASPLVQTALAGAGLIGALAGALGVFAVQRRQSLLGDVISHAALPGVCLGYLLAGQRDLGALLAGAFASGALAALVLHQIITHTRLKQDAALGIVLSLFFAAGVVGLTYLQNRAGGAALALEGFLFGQAAAITPKDVGLLVSVAVGIALFLAAFWQPLKLLSFDPQGADLAGFPRKVLEAALTLTIALAVVLGLQLVGVVLMVALLIAPAVAARAWTRSLGATVLLAATFGAGSGMAGALVSATARGLSTGPVVVLIALAVVALSLIFAPERGVLARRGQRHG